jgi:hypothetical protein|tara:strand:- start:345 stop:842 length:498 start_codon:yes stop_codon:yes gene_type:complete
MTLLEIAQLITSIATLILAFTLLLQLRTNHKDSEFEITYRSLEFGFKRFSSIYNNKEFRKIFVKRFEKRDKLSDEEYTALEYYWTEFLANINTDYRLGRANRELAYYELTISKLLDCKLACEWYLEKGTLLFDASVGRKKDKNNKVMISICEKYYKKITGKEIKK